MNLIAKIKMNKLYIKYLSTYEKRALFSNVLSFIFTLALVIYHITLFIIFNGLWNIVISFYYILLSVLRFIILFNEYRYKIKMLDKDTMENRRKKNLIYYSLLLLLIDISLNFPIILLAYQEEVREYNIIIAITFALITTIKFVLAIRGYIKTRKNYDTKTYIFKNITFTSALVSVISLQNVLISSVSDNPKDDAKIFVSTTFLIFGVILLVSILSIIKSIKIRKALK